MRQFLRFSAIAIFAALVGSSLRAQDTEGPKYEGKPLAYWIERIQTCEKDGDRNAAATAIKAFGADAAPAIPKLVKMMEDRSEEYCNLIGGILYQMGPQAKSAVPALVRSLKDKTAGCPEAVFMVLEAIGPDAVEAVPVLVRAIEDRPFDKFRHDAAMSTLCAIGPAGKVGIPAIRQLIKELRQGKEGPYLGNLNFVRGVPNLGPDGIELLTEFLNDSAPLFVCRCAEALGEAGGKSKRAASVLVKLLDHPDPRVRYEAAAALWKIEKNEAVIPVVAKLLAEEQGNEQGYGPTLAVNLLRDIGPPAKSALQDLTKALSGPRAKNSPADAVEILEAIENIDPAEAKKLKGKATEHRTSQLVR